MRKMKIKIGFSVSLVLSLALVVTCMVKNGINANAGSVVNPTEGSLTYLTANLFDYDTTARCLCSGNWIVGADEYSTDENLIMFGQNIPDVQPVPSNYNAWTDLSQSNIVKGLVESTLNEKGLITLANDRVAISDSEMVNLFDTTDCKHYVGSYNFPFVNTGDGYLEYSSRKNHVNITDTVASNGNYEMTRTEDGLVSEAGFMPFNELDSDGGIVSTDEDGNSYYGLVGEDNYNLGMTLEFKFNMTEDRMITTYDGSKEDMVFEFGSDDDLWVFVDGELVLDLGGVHDAVAGCMNFTNGSVYTCGYHYDANGDYVVDDNAEYTYNSYIKSLEMGEHDIKVFFLQRGGDKSEFMLKMRLQDAIGTDEEVENTSHPKCTYVPEDPTTVPATESPKTEEPKQTTTPTKEPEKTAEPTNKPVETVAPTKAPTVPIDDPDVPASKGDDAVSTPKPVVINDNTAPTAVNNDNSKALALTSIDDNATPLATLPQTGTVAEEVFYILGALLIIGGLFVAFYPKKRVNK